MEASKHSKKSAGTTGSGGKSADVDVNAKQAGGQAGEAAGQAFGQVRCPSCLCPEEVSKIHGRLRLCHENLSDFVLHTVFLTYAVVGGECSAFYRALAGVHRRVLVGLHQNSE